jgi:uncharacterized integral membrane protein (TIGR00698 family)
MKEKSGLEFGKEAASRVALATRSIVPRVALAAWSAAPGVALCAALGAGALWLHGLPGLGILSALILAILLGIAVRNMVGVREAFQPGIAVCLRQALRVAIVLLGLQLSLQDIAQVGFSGFALVAATLTATLMFTKWLGSALGIDRRLAELIAAGTAICGASAVIAANAVTEGSDEDVAYGVAVVTVFGTASMFLYPLLAHALELRPEAFGVWAGASIHEVAQVVATAFQGGRVSGQIGTIVKLTRVMLLAPAVVALGALRRDTGAVQASGEPQAGTVRAPGEPLEAETVRAPGARRIPVPWFVVGFVAMTGLASLGIVPEGVKAAIKSLDLALMAAALAAMGLETRIARLCGKGWKPLLVGAGAWLFISIFSYGLVRLCYR